MYIQEYKVGSGWRGTYEHVSIFWAPGNSRKEGSDFSSALYCKAAPLLLSLNPPGAICHFVFWGGERDALCGKKVKDRPDALHANSRYRRSMYLSTSTDPLFPRTLSTTAVMGQSPHSCVNSSSSTRDCTRTAPPRPSATG